MWFKNKECEAPTCSRERLKPTHQEPIERQWIFQPVDGRSPGRACQADPADQPFGIGGKTLAFNVILGQKHRIPVRLVVNRLPSDVYRKRQKAAKRKGCGISLLYLKFLKYTFFITNVPSTLRPKGGRRYGLSPSRTCGTDLQALEIAVLDQCPERYPAGTHSLPHLWPTDRYPGGAEFDGVGFRQSKE